MALFYPTISKMTAFNQYLSQLPEGLKAMFGPVSLITRRRRL